MGVAILATSDAGFSPIPRFVCLLLRARRAWACAALSCKCLHLETVEQKQNVDLRNPAFAWAGPCFDFVTIKHWKSIENLEGAPKVSCVSLQGPFNGG
eukprot:12048630-Alexandrium_andersonii.AAC.1